MGKGLVFLLLLEAFRPIRSSFCYKKLRGGSYDESEIEASDVVIPDRLRVEGSSSEIPSFLKRIIAKKKRDLGLGGLSQADAKAVVDAKLRESMSSTEADESRRRERIEDEKISYLNEEARKKLEKEEASEERAKIEKRRASRESQGNIDSWIARTERKQEKEEKEREMEKLFRERYQPAIHKRIRYNTRIGSAVDFDWKLEEDTTLAQYQPYEMGRMPIFEGTRRIGGKRNEANVSGTYDDLGLDIFEYEDQRHWSEKTLEEMTDRDWRILREDYRISFRGNWKSNPLRNWDEGIVPEPILRAIDELGYERPTAVQMAAIPVGLSERDILGVASTGSGKTCAYVVPLLMHMMDFPKLTAITAEQGPYGLIIAPTRELSEQIEKETSALAKFTGFRIISLVAGVGVTEQGTRFRLGREIVVGTPGRISDMLDKSHIVLNQCSFVIIDEADRMVEMGALEQIQKILDAMPFSHAKPHRFQGKDLFRKTYMFSATMPKAIEKLAVRYMRSPVYVQIGELGEINENIKQEVIFLDTKTTSGMRSESDLQVGEDRNDKRIQSLQALLQNHFKVERRQVIVFVNSKDTAEAVSRKLEIWKYRVDSIHSGKRHNERHLLMESYRSKKFDIMVATDIMGRGIDVKDVGLVVNYQMPSTIQQYVHRIGRTGRAGQKGKAISFVTIEDKNVFPELKKVLRSAGSHVPYEVDSVAFDETGRVVHFE